MTESPHRTCPPDAAARQIPPIIDALAGAFRACGVVLATNHPGFHSHALASALSGESFVTSANERSAYAVAWGAAVGGLRSVVTLKNVGLNDAADPFLNSLTLDLTAALVVVVFDDTDVEQSQARFDSRHYQGFLGGLWMEPATLQEGREMARLAVENSERFSSPVVLRVTNRLAASPGRDSTSADAVRFEPLPPPPVFQRQPSAFVVHPARHHEHGVPTLEHKHRAWDGWVAREWIKRSASWRPDSLGNLHMVVGSAAAPPEAEEESIAHWPFLPVPASEILASAGAEANLFVHEHGDPVVAQRLAACRIGQPSIRTVSSGTAEPNRSFHNSGTLSPLFASLRKLPQIVLVGDVGGHTMDPERSIDACLSYGSSVAVATGLAVADSAKTVACIIGDGAWLHGGRSALAEAVARRCRLLVIVIDNGGCRSTGGQRAPGDLAAPAEGVEEIILEFADFEAFCQSGELPRLASRPGVKIIYLRIPL